MKHDEKCRKIIQHIVLNCNAGKPVGFESDWGGNSLTVTVSDGHSHAGNENGTFEQLVDNLGEKGLL